MRHETTELQQLYDAWKGCERCDISAYRERVVFGTGNPDADILFVSDAPTPTEERLGEHNTSDLRWLMRVHRHAVMDKDTSLYEVTKTFFASTFLTSSVLCCPRYPKGDLAGQAKAPEWAQVKACRDRLLKTIYAVDPHIIIAAGAFALQALTGRNKHLPTRSGKLSEMFTVEVEGELGPVYYSAIPAPDPHIAERRGDYDDPNGRVASLSCAISGAWELVRHLANEDLGGVDV